MLAELLWLPVVATHQLHCRALRGWELPSRSKKDQRVEWTMGRNLRWRIRRTGLQQRRPSRSTTRSIWGGVPQGRCGKLRCAKRWNCPRCSKGAGFYWTGPPTMWLGAHAGLRWSMPCGRVLNAATKCGRKLWAASGEGECRCSNTMNSTRTYPRGCPNFFFADVDQVFVQQVMQT